MPRRSPHVLRTALPDLRSRDSTSTLFVSSCPGPRACSAVHTYLFVDGLDVITRGDSRVLGPHPRQLLRPGGPLYPTDAARRVRVASLDPSEPDAGGLDIRVRLQGETVIWSDLMYPGRQSRVAEEVRFHPVHHWTS
jgi:hypothetical protein